MSDIFPLDLQLEILSYVAQLDKLEYARCNRSLCRELMARLRIISIRNERMEYFSSESFRNKILRLLVDPYEQLELYFTYYDYCINFPENSHLISDLRTLSVYIKDFLRISPFLSRVQHLRLEWEREDRECTIPQFSGLKKLSLINCQFLHEPLNHQIDLRSLCYLQLSGCRSLSDVSCLGHIPELHLLHCNDLVDISCLNHNEIIMIDSCPIQDYSKSFRFSRIITVIVSFHSANFPSIKGITLNNLEAVQSLTIHNERMYFPDPLCWPESLLPSSLHCLTLKGFQSLIFVPPCHCLKDITISQCREVSLLNLETIKYVKIESCGIIDDWSRLQNNRNVEISFCESFNSGKLLSQVKKLTLITNTLNNMEDLTNITHLKLGGPIKLVIEPRPYIASTTKGKQLFSSANNLQEIEIEVNFLYPNSSFLSSFMKSPQLKRIIMSLPSSNKRNFEVLHQRIVQDFGRFYQVEIKPPRNFVLLKKDKRKKTSLSLLSIFDYLIKR